MTATANIAHRAKCTTRTPVQTLHIGLVVRSSVRTNRVNLDHLVHDGDRRSELSTVIRTSLSARVPSKRLPEPDGAESFCRAIDTTLML